MSFFLNRAILKFIEDLQLFKLHLELGFLDALIMQPVEDVLTALHCAVGIALGVIRML